MPPTNDSPTSPDSAASSPSELARPDRIKAEVRSDALGIGTSAPRLSWVNQTSQSDWHQSWYEIARRELAYEPADTPWPADDKSAGALSSEQTIKVESSDSVLIDWPFAPLRSRARCQVRIRVAGPDNKQGPWSHPLTIETGLLDASDWTALPITSELADQDEERPVRFRRSFTTPSAISSARLYASALGLYQAEINGQTVGQDVLAPGWTSYTHRLRYQTFDVTEYIRTGDNAIGFTVSEGWYRGRMGWEDGRRSIYGERIGPIAQLELTFEDGTLQTINSDGNWASAHGPITSAGIYDGECYDARLDEPAWSTAIFNDNDWHPTQVLDSVAPALEAPVGPAIRAKDPIEPQAVLTSPSGKTIIDFGQNLSGRVRITVEGESGRTITLRHAEVLEDGELGVRPLREAKQTDQFTLSGIGTETFEPSFTIHGFRYVEVDGLPDPTLSGSLVAVPCYSDMEPTGTFTCSNEDLNQLHSNVVWSMLGNFVDIPTDCPQRDERLGWTGDIQVFAPTASFLFDCTGFLSSWLQDLAAEQEVEGSVPFFVPWIDLGFPAWPAAAWGDAAVIVPWVLYQRFGDVGVLRRQYKSMTAWVDQVAELAGEDHLWNEGLQFGDWLDPAAPADEPSYAKTDPSLVATAHHAYTARLLSEIAGILDNEEDRLRYEELATAVTTAFVNEYVTPSGRMASDAQTAHALALQFDLLPTSRHRERAGRRLRHLVQLDKYRIGTGFVGTPLMCDALTEAGYLDDAYFLLLQPECPSWLYPVSMGATTIWERWDSMLPDGSINPGQMTSFNHYALGAVADFLHRTVAGLSPAGPGYRTIRVRPLPGGGLTSAAATHLTPYGQAKVSWTRENDVLRVTATIPPSCQAVIELPDTDSFEVGSGEHEFVCTYRPADEDPTEMPVIPGPFS